MHGFMPACHPDSLMPCRGSWHFCWIATVFCVVSRSGPHARAGSGYFPPGDGRWRVAPISRLDLVVSMLRGRPETVHCVPQGALYCRETTPFLCFSYKFLVPATRVVCDHEAVNRAQGEKDAGDVFPAHSHFDAEAYRQRVLVPIEIETKEAWDGHRCTGC